MRGWCILIVSVSLALLSGCASIGRSAGFTVQEREGMGVQEPWHNLALRENVAEVGAVAVAYVPLPQPLPRRLEKEFVYIRPTPDGKEKMRLERWTFRALLYRGESFTGIFDAVLNKQRTGFFVLLPNENGAQYAGNNLVILSSDAKWLMTTNGKLVDLPKGQSFLELLAGFFREHPSVLTQVVEMSRSDPAGKKFLAGLEELFSQHFTVSGKLYSGRQNVKMVATNFTAESNVLDRLISCGSGTASLAWLHPIGLAISAGPQIVHDVNVAMKENCDE